jgi:4'-phosphopantetheinyl transferase
MTGHWPWGAPSAADIPQPKRRVDCWAISLDSVPDAAGGTVTGLLSAGERERAERFRFERHRRMYVSTHAALRLLLSRYLQVPPLSLTIAADPNGRPVLPYCSGLHFNLSHSGTLALVVASCLAPVGVDIEEIRDVPDFVDIARRFFAQDEVDQILRLPEAERLSGFFATWTRKEAYVKALGLGLSFPLDAFSTGRPNGAPKVSHAGGPVDLNSTLADLSCDGAYHAALAVLHPNVEIDCRDAAWSWLLGGIHSSALTSAIAASTAFES